MIHVDRVHLVTDAPLGDAQARSLSTAVVAEVNTVLQAARTPAPRVHIGELQLTVPRSALADRRAMTRCARGVAQRILDRTPE